MDRTQSLLACLLVSLCLSAACAGESPDNPETTGGDTAITSGGSDLTSNDPEPGAVDEPGSEAGAEQVAAPEEGVSEPAFPTDVVELLEAIAMAAEQNLDDPADLSAVSGLIQHTADTGSLIGLDERTTGEAFVELTQGACRRLPRCGEAPPGATWYAVGQRSDNADTPLLIVLLGPPDEDATDQESLVITQVWAAAPE